MQSADCNVLTWSHGHRKLVSVNETDYSAKDPTFENVMGRCANMLLLRDHTT
jgi:hypothetical protein